MFGIHEPSVPSINSRHNHFTFPNKQGLFSKQQNEVNKCCKNFWGNPSAWLFSMDFPRSRHFYGYTFGKSFVHPATQTGATQIKLTALDCPLPLEKDPKDFSRSPAMVFFVTNLANYPPPHRKSKSTCPLKRNYFKRKNTSNHRFSGDMLVFGGSISLTFG